MNIISLDGGVHVTLSEQNLRQLLAGLEHLTDPEGPQPHLYRVTQCGLLWVTAETDEQHYANRQAGPGLAPFLPDDKEEG